MTRRPRVFVLEVYRNPTSKCISREIRVARKAGKKYDTDESVD